MNMNFACKQIFTNFFVFFLFLWAISQEEKKTRRKDNYATTTGGVNLSYFVPNAYGDNFLSEGYKLNGGFNANMLFFLNETWALGGRLSHFKGEVVDVSKVGNIETTGITHINVSSGYSFLNNKDRLSLIAGLGIGYASYLNRIGPSKFKDNGFSLLFFGEGNYRFSEFIGVYFGIQNNYDFLGIKSAESQESFFKRPKFYAFSLGIRFYII